MRGVIEGPLTLGHHSQKILAERQRWPDGALQACWDLELRHPRWRVSWLAENTIRGFERPAGYWAILSNSLHSAEVFREDLAELEQVMESVPEEHDYDIYGLKVCSWCLRQGGRRVKL
jgi:hypothetical protein